MLLIAYHFPPVRVSSGLQRTLANTRYLPDAGWTPVVITANPRAYRDVDSGQLKDIPRGTAVHRCAALDTSRHLAVGGRYISWMALPDPWSSWVPFAVMRSLWEVKTKKIDIVWSTFPIASAHLIALIVTKITRLPWIADFRDSMTEDDYPTDKRKWSVYRWIEEKTIRHCRFAIFTTESAAAMYAARYPEEPSAKWQVIPNGYDETIFEEIETAIKTQPTAGNPLTILHGGVIYPSERDPTAFFDALKSLRDAEKITAETFQVKLRASGHDSVIRPMLEMRNLTDIVTLLPPLPFRKAVEEAFASDALLILQGKSCDHQIPAKLYEYFRAGKPILVLANSDGDTARTANEAGIRVTASLECKGSIQGLLEHFLAGPDNPDLTPTRDQVSRYSRKAGVLQLGRLAWRIIGCK
ncbi:glycosyltransferase [Chromatocurvus halotolerans]|uniref:Glycosyltransferase involved in cell wall biosynthesis n=2 Tax=Chromatocurvus halotolerans TaxID=1132028 RepID=A0A4R2L583_9GAMM|nr:glycosyltransferase [Chromatocurvus halotolerans]TCO74305.1 glycosyltransferase involved in cell wall biosynthesis [Chromatocurvus halotolerans]